ncbi:hypothetical protein ACFLTP_07920 [Chloroflexota bacterium]
MDNSNTIFEQMSRIIQEILELEKNMVAWYSKGNKFHTKPLTAEQKKD